MIWCDLHIIGPPQAPEACGSALSCWHLRRANKNAYRPKNHVIVISWPMVGQLSRAKFINQSQKAYLLWTRNAKSRTDRDPRPRQYPTPPIRRAGD